MEANAEQKCCCETVTDVKCPDLNIRINNYYAVVLHKLL